MKRVVMAIAVSMFITAGAVAQPGPSSHGWDSGAFWRGAPAAPRDRIRFLQDRINRGAANGDLDRREAQRAGRELEGVRDMITQMHHGRHDPLSSDQIARIQARLDDVGRNIHWMQHNGR